MGNYKQNGLLKKMQSKVQKQSQGKKMSKNSLVVVIALAIIAVIATVTLSAVILHKVYEPKNDESEKKTETIDYGENSSGEQGETNEKSGENSGNQGGETDSNPGKSGGDKAGETDSNPGKSGGDKAGGTDSNPGENGGKINENPGESKKKKDKLSSGGVDYLVTDGKLIISGKGTVTKKAISSMVTEYNTVDFELGTFDIGDDAFSGCSNITEMIMRDNVYSIGDRAFKGCSFATVELGTNITDIGEDAFEDCSHEVVYLKNDYIFRNFNSRYDFGGVGETANIYIYKDLMPFEYNGDYSKYNDIAGDFLVASGVFDEFHVAGETLTNQKYNYWAQCVEEDYIPIYR